MQGHANDSQRRLQQRLTTSVAISAAATFVLHTLPKTMAYVTSYFKALIKRFAYAM